MEKNTVVLTVKEYNELRDFKKNIENGKILTSISIKGYFLTGFKTCTVTDFYTESKAIENLVAENKYLNKDIDSLKTRMSNMKIFDKEKYNNTHDKVIENLKKMNFWEFRKWKNK